jgi:hypothetical protein
MDILQFVKENTPKGDKYTFATIMVLPNLFCSVYTKPPPFILFWGEHNLLDFRWKALVTKEMKFSSIGIEVKYVEKRRIEETKN